MLFNKDKKQGGRKTVENRSSLRLFRYNRASDALFPIDYMYADGIAKYQRKNLFSKTYEIKDINYLTSDYDGKKQIFEKYNKLLNSMLDDFKITVISRRLDSVTDLDSMFLQMENDKYDYLREEYNQYLSELITAANTYVHSIFLTVTTPKISRNELVSYFGRVESNLQSLLKTMDSFCIPLDAQAKLELIHKFYKSDDNINLPVEFDDRTRKYKGESYKELICPNIQVDTKSFAIDDRFGQVMVFERFPTYLQDTLLNDMLNIGTDIAISISSKPLTKEKAVKLAQDAMMSSEKNALDYQRKNANKPYPVPLTQNLIHEQENAVEFYKEILDNDQKVFYSTVTLIHLADSKEQLKNNAKRLTSLAAEHQIGLVPLFFPSRQIDGIRTTLPFGADEIEYTRTLQTQVLANLMPFQIQDIIHSNGIVYGTNKVSGNLIIVDRQQLINSNAWILGKTGGGKSFFAKQEMIKIILRDPTADLIIIDPENEYTPIISALGGETIDISSTSPNHINPLDITPNYGEKNGVPLPEKAEFILSLFELILEDKFSGMHQSVLDRCVKNVLQPYIDRGYTGATPTLHDLYDELFRVKDSDLAIAVAQELALEVEMFIKGTLDTFAYQTNVHTDAKVLCYNIKDLGNSLRGIGMLTVLDNVLNRISYNNENGRKTYIFIDEIYLLFMHEYSAEFLFKLWKRIRKYNGSCTGITQNVSDILQSDRAETMLSNSELVVMLAQATSDMDKLSYLLHISEEEAQYVQGVPQGEGLIHIGDKNIPFKNKVPSNMQIYKLCSTKPGE